MSGHHPFKRTKQSLSIPRLSSRWASVFPCLQIQAQTWTGTYATSSPVLLPVDWDWKSHPCLCFWGFALGLAPCAVGCLASPACWLKTMGLLSLDNHVSQFFVIHFLFMITGGLYCFYCSGTIWWIHLHLEKNLDGLLQEITLSFMHQFCENNWYLYYFELLNPWTQHVSTIMLSLLWFTSLHFVNHSL